MNLINAIIDGRDFNKDLIDPNKEYGENGFESAFENVKTLLDDLKNDDIGGGHSTLRKIVRILGRFSGFEEKLPKKFLFNWANNPDGPMLVMYDS